jgi:septal ring factor EnvC (AmiA/AmiB activator)
MLKKTSVFSLLAAAMIIAPSAAFAGDSGTRQELNQSATSINNSRVDQAATQTSIQYRNNRAGSRYGSNCPANQQSQRSNQRIDQNGVAINDSVVSQRANQANLQRQVGAGQRYCR